MSTRPVVTGHVLDCDVCAASLEDGDYVARFPTPAAAAQAGIDNGWTEFGLDRHACPRTSQGHDTARQLAA